MRVPEVSRIELRAVDGSANPYLAFTAVLAAGLDGVDRELDPGRPNADNLYAFDPDVVACQRHHRDATDTAPRRRRTRRRRCHAGSASATPAARTTCDYFAKVKSEEFRAVARRGE